MFRPPAKYRCAKCRRRINEKSAVCEHCNWQIDLPSARIMAIEYARMRRFFRWQKFKSSIFGSQRLTPARFSLRIAVQRCWQRFKGIFARRR